MGEIIKSYGDLQRLMDTGVRLDLTERKVSYLTGVGVLNEGLKNQDGPLTFRIYEPGDGSFGEYVYRKFTVDDVEEFDDKRVYYVTSAEGVPEGVVDFMIEHFDATNMPNEVSWLSSHIDVEPV